MIKNVIANWAEIFFTTISVFVLYPFLVNEMGESQYGIWLLIASITGYFSLIQLGIPISLVRHLSKYYAEKDYLKVNGVVNSSVILFFSLSVLVVIAGFIIMLVTDLIFKIPDEYIQTARIVIMIVTLNVALNFIFEVFEGILNAFQNFTVLSGVKVALLFIRVGLTFLIVTFTNGLYALALILLSVSLLQWSILFVYVRRKYNFIKFDIKLFDKVILKQIFGYSVFALLIQVAARISFQTAPIIIGALISTSAIVYYTIGSNFLLYLTEFIRGIARVLMPKSSDLDGKQESAALKHIYLNYSKLTYFIVMLACMIFILLGKDFISIWMGDSFRTSSGNILIILSISYLFYLVQRGVGHPILMGTSNIKFLTYVMVGTAILNFILSVVLGKYYDIYGVAWGTAIPNLINTVIMIFYTTNLLKINTYEYIFKTILIPTVSVIFIVIPIIFIKQIMIIDTYAEFFLVAVSVSIFYALVIFWGFIGGANRNQILRFIKVRREI